MKLFKVLKARFSYLRRIVKAYILPSTSQLTFWHGIPEKNPEYLLDDHDAYYMKFHYKADYTGHYDENRIPMLNYHGSIGLQYNPIAISQYGLGNYNLYLETKDVDRIARFIDVANWLVQNLEKNSKGVYVWHHYFDFEYRSKLISPWYSGLAQGLGLSVLVRAYKITADRKYLECCQRAFVSMTLPLEQGGVLTEEDGYTWIEEYMVNPPTHILNGFIWALWGVYDVYLYLDWPEGKELFDKCVLTLEKNLYRYDTGYWSLYENSFTSLPMITSTFYHKLHIVQLQILFEMTKKPIFRKYSLRWKSFESNRMNRYRAIFVKILFKLFYY